jgi:transposase
MFKLGLKNIKGHEYVYAQESIYMSREKTKTKSYSLGTVKDFIANLNVVLNKGNVFTYSGEVCISKMAEKIGFFRCINKCASKKWGYDLPGYLLTLIVYQILNPDSKSRCREWYQNSYMQYVVRLPEIAFHKNNIYEFMDKIQNKELKIFRGLRDAVISVIKIKVSKIVFDTTSMFFRVTEFAVEDSFRRRGHSRDNRPDLVQVVLAVCTTDEGFPLYYRTYPGNTSDFHAFKNFLHDFDTEIKPIHKKGITWIIFDKGNTSKETIQKLDKISESFKEGYLTYITTVKLNDKVLDALEYMEICQVDDRKYNVSEMYTESHNGVKRVLVVYDPELKNKQIKKLEAKYKKVKSELDHLIETKKDLVKHIEDMSELIKKNKLTTIFKIERKGEKVWYREDKSAKEKKFRKARTFAILTNNFTAKKEELISYYIGRNRIEQTIRELKHSIDIRPVFHHLKRRIKTHAFIVMTGYLLLYATKIYLQKQGLTLTTERLLHALRTGYVEIIKWSEAITIEYPKNISSDIEKIFEKLKIPLPKL